MRNLHVYGGRFCNEKYTGNWLCWVNKIQINVHTGIYTVLICNILIHPHLRVFSITKSLYLTHKSLISLLNNTGTSFTKNLSEISMKLMLVRLDFQMMITKTRKCTCIFSILFFNDLKEILDSIYPYSYLTLRLK